MADRSESEKSIFLEAVEIVTEDDRRAYLDRVCAEDGPMRAKLEALLAAHARPQRLIDTAVDASPTVLERPETQIGPYKLLEQIGEGGMGVVYMAEQKRAGPPPRGAEDHQAGHGHAGR